MRGPTLVLHYLQLQPCVKKQKTNLKLLEALETLRPDLDEQTFIMDP